MSKTICIRLTDEENSLLEENLQKYYYHNTSKFIKRCIFEKEIHYIAHDSNLEATLNTLRKLLVQYQKIGVNYNQCVKAVHRAYGEKRATAMLQNLTRNTIDLIALTEEIVESTQVLQAKNIL